MKNPLTKRLPRELKSEFGKYLVIFLLLIISIGFVSGFLVADGSMIRTYNEGFQKYNIENGHFQIAKKQQLHRFRQSKKMTLPCMKIFIPKNP